MPKEILEEKAIREAKEQEDNLAAETERLRVAKEAEDKAEVERLEAETTVAALDNAPKTVSLKGVTLKGSHSQMKGTHTVHLNESINIVFVDGQANVTDPVSDQLKNAGYIE